MTEITGDHVVGGAGAAADAAERNVPEQPVAAQREHDPLIQIELTGCPNAVPRMMVARSRVDQGTLKMPFGNGYDHFVFHSYVNRNGNLVPVFTWTDRTRIAE